MMYKNYGVYDDRPIDYTKPKTKKQKEKIKRYEHKIKIIELLCLELENTEIMCHIISILKKLSCHTMLVH